MENIKSKYDSSLDVEIKRQEFELEYSKIIVALCCYNNGERKIQISRMKKDGENWKFTKLGRLNKLELQEIIPALVTRTGEM